MSENNNVRKTLPELGSDFFSAFEDASYEQWKEEALRTLKGAPFEKKLLSKTYEGIDLQPIYNADDISDLPTTDAEPGQAPFVRGNNSAGYTERPWRIAQETIAADPAECNRQLRDSLERGGNAVNLVLHGADRAGLAPTYMGDLMDALDGITIDQQPVYLQCGAFGFGTASMLIALARESGVDTVSLTGCLGSDPLDVLAREGRLPTELSDLYDEMASLVAWSMEHAPELKTLPVSSRAYHDAGAHAAEELACALATGVEYLKEMTARGIPAADAAPRFQLNLSVAGDFFMEIAKLRAARALWCQVAEAFGVPVERASLTIHGRTSNRFMSALDPHVNMLRATTSGFAAIVGGVDSLHTGPFNETTGDTDDFSRRVARNLQSVLKDECHLDRLVDPAGGSYYVEQITDELARQSWSIFQEIEQRGGMSNALAEGYPQEMIQGTAAARLKDIHTRKAVQVGVNKYANPDDSAARLSTAAPLDLEQKLQSYKTAVRSTVPKAPLEMPQDPCTAHRFHVAVEAAIEGAALDEISPVDGDLGTLTIEPLRPMRTSQPYEELRRRTAGNPPKVFLANLGPIPQHKARADFSRDFFSVGGFQVLTNDGFETPEAAAEAAIQSGALITVICSTDSDYPESVPRFMTALGTQEERIQVILAGYPKDQIEAHRQAGVDEFIHLRADNHQILENLLTLTGGAK